MQNKTPQGKADPVPTPEQELERYGVWVKSEPQDILDEHVIDRETIVELPAEKPEAALPLQEAEPAFDTLEDLPPLEEAFEDDFSSDEAAPGAMPSSGEEPFEVEELASDVLEESVIDIDLDELEPSQDEAQGLDALEELAADDTSLAADDADKDSFESTEISIEDFGLSDDSDSLSGPSLENLEADLEAFSEPSEEAAPEQGFETLDIDLAFDDTIPSVDTTEAAAGEAAPSDGFETIDIDSFDEESVPDSSAETASALDTEELSLEAHPDELLSSLPEDSAGDAPVSLDAFIDDDASSAVVPSLEIEDVTLGEDSSEPDTGFDDIKALEDELSGEAAIEPAGANAPSADLLGKIALELSSIKDELVSLRSQLSSLKAAGVAPAEETAPEPEVPEEESAAGGFFDDEDDDTIALTGDELDNILNTADFTEESVADEGSDLVDSPELEVSPDLDLLPENGDYQAGIESIELPIVEADETEQEALSARAEDLAPLTPAPEDTSFLDTEEGLGELEGMPLEDVPLVEPDPSDLDIIIDSAFGSDDEEELPVIEPIEEAAETELEEFGTEELEPEIVLDIDAGDEPVVSTVDAFPETLEELDDSIELEEILEPEDLGGLALHSEEPAPLAEPEEPVSYGPEASIDSLESLEAMADELSEETGIPETLETIEEDSFLLAEGVPLAEAATEPEPEPEVEALEELIIEEPEPLEPEPLEPEAVVEREPVTLDEEPSRAPREAPVADSATGPAPKSEPGSSSGNVPDKLKHDVKSVLLYLDQLLASLPEEKIEEFASSEYYDTYKRLFDDLGLL